MYKISKRVTDDYWEDFFHIEDIRGIGCSLTTPDGRFLKVNQSLCKILEFSGSELLNFSVKNYTHVGDIQADMEELEELRLEKKGFSRLIKRLITKTNQVVWVIVTIIPIHESGKVSYFLSIVDEVREDKFFHEPDKTVDFMSVVRDNLKTFVITCLTSVSLLVTLGVTFYTTVEKVSSLEKESEQQQSIILKLLEKSNETKIRGGQNPSP